MSEGNESHHGQLSDEELREILDAHEKWLTSNGKEGTRADLRAYTDLMGGRLRRANLTRFGPPSLNRIAGRPARAPLRTPAAGC